MNTPFKILAIAGSNRKNSYNMALLRAARELAREDLEIEIYDLSDIPMFNEDLEADPPEIISEFKAKISAADGLLIAAPEYNYSLSAILKNAIDWASRPANASPLDMKPAAIMGGTIGMSGTIRSQHHLRQVALWTNMMDMKKPEVYVVRIHEKFDKNLNLIDEALKKHLSKFLSAFENWISIFKNVRSDTGLSMRGGSIAGPSLEMFSKPVLPPAGPSEEKLTEAAKFWEAANIE